MALQIEFKKQYSDGSVADGIFRVKTKAACMRHAKGVRGNITYLIQVAPYYAGYKLDVDDILGDETYSVNRTN